MKIDKITVRYLAAPLSTTYWMSLEPYRVTDELLIQIVTEDGLVGTGVSHGRPMREIIRIIQDAFTPILVGQNPLDHERLWQEMFAMTHSRQEGVFAPEGAPHFGSGLRAQGWLRRCSSHRWRRPEPGCAVLRAGDRPVGRGSCP